MLQTIEAAYFESLKGKTVSLALAHGNRLDAVVDEIGLKPLAKMPESTRMPFVVSLSADDTSFESGLCTFELPEIGLVEDVYISRVASLGRDPRRTYFSIVFN